MFKGFDENSPDELYENELDDEETNDDDDEISTKTTLPDYIEKWNIGLGINKMRCNVCFRFPKIIGRHTKNNIPKMTQSGGTQYRKKVLLKHLSSKYHVECMRASLTSPLLEAIDSKRRTTLQNMILGSQTKIANTIGRRAISVYADAKCLSNSARSWAARQMAERFADSFDFNDMDKNEENIEKISLNYINPNFHAEILDCIVKVERNVIANKIKECVALSLRVDGSVDRTCIDKIYVIAKTVDSAGHLDSIFVGVCPQTERKASGLYEAMKCAINNNGEDLYDICLKKMSSFVTDGASVNTGERNGLWKIIDDDAKRLGVSQNIIKIWCAAHRSDLILKDLKKKFPSLKSMFEILKNISAHFNVSAMRSNELDKVSTTNKTNLSKMPRYNEVRWSEYSSNLFHAILVSWNSLVIYFGHLNDLEDKYYKDYLTNHENLKLITFMADVMSLFTIFQKRIQADDLNVITLNRHLQWFRNKIEQIQTKDLSDGWVCKLNAGIETVPKNVNGEVMEIKTLKGIELTNSEPRRNRNNFEFNSVRRKLVNCILNFLEKRFAVDEKLLESIGPFCRLDPSADVKGVMGLIAPDVNDFELQMQYGDLCTMPEIKNLSLTELLPVLANGRENFHEVFIVLARIAAATPHSADVERSISANNRLKTPGRSSFDITSENKWLFIHFNLPVLQNWNPRKAVVEWLNRKDRRHHELTVEASKNGARKSTSQPYFRGIFEAATGKRSVPDLDDDQLQEEAEILVIIPSKRMRHCF